MPSINELFAAPGSEAEEDFDLDFDKLMGAVDQSLAESTRFRDDVEVADGEEVAVGDGDDEPAEEEVQPVVEEAGAEEDSKESAVQDPPPVIAADPLGLLPPERRAALLAIDEASQRDPQVQERVLRALQPEIVAPVVPTLPDDIEEGSVAARLWMQQQETQAQMAKIGGAIQAQQQAFAKQAAVSAAEAAGDEFAKRYPQLEQSDIVAIAQIAGTSGLAAKLANGASDLKGAYVQALDSVLWTNELFRSKVQGVVEPEVKPAERPETKARKRKLTALSSAASPVSSPRTPKSPLETRVDGRLTPESRQRTVMEMATKLNRATNEGGL